MEALAYECILCIFVSAFSMFKEKVECTGSETWKNRFHTAAECAQACAKHSDMFIFGTNDYGTNRCTGAGCSCYCELSTKEDSSTKLPLCNSETGHNGYRLYRFTESRFRDRVKGRFYCLK